MIETWESETEERIRAAAVLPRLPGPLRSRVLEAARTAHRRRMWRNGLLSAAALLISVTSLGVWTNCRWNADCVEVGPAPTAAHQETSPDIIQSGMSGIGQWDHVEAEQREREQDRRKLFAAPPDHR